LGNFRFFKFVGYDQKWESGTTCGLSYHQNHSVSCAIWPKDWAEHQTGYYAEEGRWREVTRARKGETDDERRRRLKIT
jgi:hypothetical protein